MTFILWLFFNGYPLLEIQLGIPLCWFFLICILSHLDLSCMLLLIHLLLCLILESRWSHIPWDTSFSVLVCHPLLSMFLLVHRSQCCWYTILYVGLGFCLQLNDSLIVHTSVDMCVLICLSLALFLLLLNLKDCFLCHTWLTLFFSIVLILYVLWRTSFSQLYSFCMAFYIS